MITVVGIKFKETGKVYFFDPKDFKIKEKDYVIVETARGTECGMCSSPIHQVSETEVVGTLKPVIRMATEEDKQTLKRNKEKEKDAFELCEKKIADRALEMKLIDVEYAFDGSKVIFYFTADGRIDFRELVKDLAAVLKTRIELRQIGVRDEAKMIGGLGLCGREFCCSSFLSDFVPVSIKMAKEQGLSLNPTKMSGTCGRLMCCLKYEQEAYEDLIKNSPKVNSLLDTPDGKGIVTEVSLLTGLVKVRLDKEESVVRIFTKEELGFKSESKSFSKKEDDFFKSFKNTESQPKQDDTCKEEKKMVHYWHRHKKRRN